MIRLQPVHPARKRSLWLEEALALEPEAEHVEPLAGAHRADVCIVGGGFTGLWTALRLKELDPSVEVTLLEAELCGSGASGRNGGFVLAWWNKLESLVKLCGEDEALGLCRAAAQAVLDIGTICDAHGIGAHFCHGGSLWTATTPLHLGGWDRLIAACERRGVAALRRLPPAEIAARTGSAVHLAVILDTSGATIQPALLARGLRRVALARGVRIYERSLVTQVDRGARPVVRTAHGAVAAEKVVLATNAWAASLPALRRAIVPMTSDVVVTAPVPDRLREIGWTGGEAISDGRMMVQYYRTTHDGRIVFGRGGGTIAFHGRVTPTFDQDAGRAVEVARGLRRIYPMLADVPLTHDWSGAVDRAENGLPFFGRLDGDPRVLYGVGFSGTGVGQTRLGGCILASSALDRQDEWAATPLNRGPVSQFPPEPARYVGGLLVRAAVARKEDLEEQGQRPGPVLRRLAALAPSGMGKRKETAPPSTKSRLR